MRVLPLKLHYRSLFHGTLPPQFRGRKGKERPSLQCILRESLWHQGEIREGRLTVLVKEGRFFCAALCVYGENVMLMSIFAKPLINL